MLLYRTRRGAVVEFEGRYYGLPDWDWDTLINRDDLTAYLHETLGRAAVVQAIAPGDVLAPIGRQEVWAAGVTYLRSRSARMEESQQAGGADFYDRVYHADRPELFMKATAHRVVGPGGQMHLRSDSRWIVPEPELTLCVTRTGKIVGYTIGNDLSCRDIEGENPLYLPQAKSFKACAAVGPAILVTESLKSQTPIKLEIRRGDAAVFTGETTIAQMKRTPQELVGWLFRDNAFPDGCLLMTGTGVVPPDGFSLQRGDEVRITIVNIGTLVNVMA